MKQPLRSSPFSRREFLRSTAVAAGAWVPCWVGLSRSEAADFQSPNARPRVGCIGNGNMGRGDATNAKRFGDIVALCDVDRARAEKMNATVADGKAQIYDDYRRLLERKDVDVVTISTPDHWHTKIAIAAMQAGKDLYCQKPLTLTIDEGKLLCRVVKETGRVLQVGTQQRSENNNRFLKAVAMVQGGRIGKVQRVTCIIGSGSKGGPFEKSAAPPGLNWDVWLGQAPKVDYIRQRCHGTFRWWYEYSGGKTTDWGAHHVDIAQWAIGMDQSGPTSIEVVSAEHASPLKNGWPTVDNWYNTATDFRVRCLFASGVEMIICGREPAVEQRNGIVFEGETGKFFVSRGELEGEPVDALEQNPIAQDVLKRLRKGKPLGSHMGNFFECVRDRGLPASDVYTHHRVLTTCHLANLAMRLGRTLKWDPIKEQFVDDQEASSFLRREQRKGYEITA